MSRGCTPAASHVSRISAECSYASGSISSSRSSCSASRSRARHRLDRGVVVLAGRPAAGRGSRLSRRAPGRQNRSTCALRVVARRSARPRSFSSTSAHVTAWIERASRSGSGVRERRAAPSTSGSMTPRDDRANSSGKLGLEPRAFVGERPACAAARRGVEPERERLVDPDVERGARRRRRGEPSPSMRPRQRPICDRPRSTTFIAPRLDLGRIEAGAFPLAAHPGLDLPALVDRRVGDLVVGLEHAPHAALVVRHDVGRELPAERQQLVVRHDVVHEAPRERGRARRCSCR